jgi:hypothetical protein
LDNASQPSMPSSVTGTAMGVSGEPTGTASDDTGAHLPAAERGRSSSHPCRLWSGAMYLAFNSVAQRQGLRMGVCRGQYRAIRCGSPTLCLCSRTRRPASTEIRLLSVCDGILIQPPFRRVFLSSPNSPVFSLLTLGHSLRCLSRALRHGAALLLRLSENLFDKAPHKTRTKRFSEPSAKAPLGTWERGTSRRFAQECPEGNPGKYKQEK